MKSNNALQLESNENDKADNNKPKALDGGFGWVIVFGSFFIFFTCKFQIGKKIYFVFKVKM